MPITILNNSSFYFVRNPTFLAAENRDFGRFVTTWYNVHCKHTLFFKVFGTFERAWLGLGMGVLGSRRCACQRNDNYDVTM